MSQPIFAAFAGPSMNPTLVEPELLEIQPYTARAPHIGDVIYFHAPDEGDIVHRIIAITPEGVRTRGDNNPRDDDWLIPPSAIIGRVVAAQRGKVRHIIINGLGGIALHRFLRVWRRFVVRISHTLHEPYHALAHSSMLCRLLPARWHPRVVTFQETRLLMFGHHVIGRYNTRRGKWDIQRPFRLFVDESEL
jgi:signal peptidase I